MATLVDDYVRLRGQCFNPRYAVLCYTATWVAGCLSHSGMVPKRLNLF